MFRDKSVYRVLRVLFIENMIKKINFVSQSVNNVVEDRKKLFHLGLQLIKIHYYYKNDKYIF